MSPSKCIFLVGALCYPQFEFPIDHKMLNAKIHCIVACNFAFGYISPYAANSAYIFLAYLLYFALTLTLYILIVQLFTLASFLGPKHVEYISHLLAYCLEEFLVHAYMNWQ